MIQQNIYAFWKYDQYPYCLWGKISEFKDDKVYVDSYQGYFKPFLICEEDHALVLAKKLLDLKDEKEHDIKVLNDNY